MPAPRAVSPNLILLACTLAFIIISLDITVVNVALETLRSAFDTSITGLQWVLNAYTLAFASLLLSTGSLGDRLGQKPVMVAGLALFTVASIFCGLAGSINTLIVARICQGVAAALCVPSSLSLINLTFTDSKARARAIGIWAGTASLALGAGPVIGGLLIAHFGWQSIFLINVPFGLVGIWLTLAYAPDKMPAAARSLDLPGQILGILALAALAAGCVESGAYGWGSPIVVGALAGFVLFGAGFLLVEARTKHPMLPLALFSTPSVSVTSAIGLMLNFGYYGIMFAISVYFQSAKGYGPLDAGMAFLPMTAVLSVVNFASGPLNGRFGSRVLIHVGLGLSLIGYLSLCGIGPDTAYLHILLGLVAVGIGLALSVPAVSVVLMDGVDPAQAGIASGVFNTARQIGGVIGVGVFGSLLAGDRDTVVQGMNIAFVLSALAMAIALGICIFGMQRRALEEAAGQ